MLAGVGLEGDTLPLERSLSSGRGGGRGEPREVGSGAGSQPSDGNGNGGLGLGGFVGNLPNWLRQDSAGQ
jgi:hypothetical protein